MRKYFASVLTAAFACAISGAFAAPVRIDVKAGESLIAVRDRVRALSASEKANGVEIVLAAGDYFLDRGLNLTALDSGALASAPIVWRSGKPGAARIVGSRRIPVSMFRKVEDSALLSRLSVQQSQQFEHYHEQFFHIQLDFQQLPLIQ